MHRHRRRDDSADTKQHHCLYVWLQRVPALLHLTTPPRTPTAGPEKDGFTFDRVFRSSSQQPEIFDFGVKGIVEDVMGGFNGTLFCYGQTGSGKTFSAWIADAQGTSKLTNIIFLLQL